MTSSPQANKTQLPEIQNENFEKTVLNRQPTKLEWHQRSAKSKPNYVARKVDNEELFGDTFKPTNLGLSQINEEKAYEAEDFDILVNSNDTPEVTEAKSIFQTDALVSSKYKEHNRGPVYSKGGQIVKHSIVGPVEMFERIQRSNKKPPMKDSGISSEKDNVSFSERSQSRTLKPLSSYQINDLSSSSGRIGTQASLIAKKQNPVEKKKDSRTIRVSKEELYGKIDELRQKQYLTSEKEEMKLRKLPLGDQLMHTKDGRCIEKFDRVLNEWSQTIQNFTKKTKRKAGRSVMLTTDDFRSKVEEAETFNLVKTDQEKFGTTYWYMTLRKYGTEADVGNQRVIRDIPDGFNTPQIFRPPTSLEIVKRPTKLSRTSTLLPSLSETRFLDRTKIEYISDKSALIKKDLNKVRPNPNLDVEDFLIEGRNKLELEVTGFFKANICKDTYPVPRHLFEGRRHSEEEETIAMHYDNREVIKNGLSVFMV